MRRDEILYHAKLHPEQYSNTFTPEQLKQLHTSIRYVCQTAVDLLADSSKFPDDWLFKHRWGKGKKDKVMALPSGEKITFLTVGGRTSCIVPSIQKTTGAVAGDIKKEQIDNLSGEENGEESELKPKRKTTKAKKVKGTAEEVGEPTKLSKKRKAMKSEEEEDALVSEEEVEEAEDEEEEEKPKSRKRKEAPTTASKKSGKTADESKKAKKETNTENESGTGRRRSTRVGKKSD